MLLAYKLIVGIVPHGDLMFETLNSVLSAVSVAGSRRSQTQLQGHPLPIQFRKDQRDGNQSSPSEKSFAFVVEKLWNRSTFPATAYSSLGRFHAALDAVNWKIFPFVVEAAGQYAQSL